MYAQWIIDTSHSQVGFSLTHLNISKILGSFNDFSGHVAQCHRDSFQEAAFVLSAKASSIDTNENERDIKLRSSEFLDVAAHPDIIFVSKGINQLDPTHFFIEGKLTLRGVSRPMSLTAHFGGSAKDKNGKKRISFEITGQLRSTDYGMQWYEETPEGTQTWSHVVLLHMFLELVPEEPFE